jgi:hypothetical protein
MAKATRVKDDLFENMNNPGDYKLTGFVDGKPGRLTFKCPCGCGTVAGISLKPTVPTGWEFDGNLDCPTTTPSIRIGKGADDLDHWHGYLTKGEFVSC